MKRIGGLIGLLVLAALACNAPIGGDETPNLPPPVISGTTQPVQTPVESPTVLDTGTEQSPSVLPTFTPIQSQSTVPAGSTPTPATAATDEATPTPSDTPTEQASGGPLSFTYTIQWQVNSNPGFATATVTINATGGSGDYQYFRDDLPVSGAVFQYQWATCRANPGSLRVDSADGQSARTNYFETPPCPASG